MTGGCRHRGSTWEIKCTVLHPERLPVSLASFLLLPFFLSCSLFVFPTAVIFEKHGWNQYKTPSSSDAIDFVFQDLDTRCEVGHEVRNKLETVILYYQSPKSVQDLPSSIKPCRQVFNDLGTTLLWLLSCDRASVVIELRSSDRASVVIELRSSPSPFPSYTGKTLLQFMLTGYELS
jgi:hypothetical protein